MPRIRKQGLVSIILSNYNNASFVTHCLDSLIAQTYPYLELIITDDASTDDSVSVIENWIATHVPESHLENHITFLKLPRNTGFTGAVTTALYLTEGEYICLHDSDDISVPTRIEKQVAFLKKHPELNAVGANYAVIEGDTLTHPLTFIQYGPQHIKDIYAQGGNCVSYGTLLIRGELFDYIGGLNRSLNGAEDYEFITRLIPYGIDNIPESLYYYRSHVEQRSRQFYGPKCFMLDHKQLRLLMVIDHLLPLDILLSLYTLIDSLISAKMHVVTLCTHASLIPYLTHLGCLVYHLDFPNDPSVASNCLAYKVPIKTIISREGCHLVHCFHPHSAALCLPIAKELNLPTFHTLYPCYCEDSFIRKYAPLITRFIVNDPSTSDWLKSQNIISQFLLPAFQPPKSMSPEMLVSLRSAWEIPNNAFVLAYTSALHTSSFITLLAELVASHSPIDNRPIYILIPPLDIAFTCPLYQDLPPEYRKYIIFAPTHLSMPNYLALADCCLVTGLDALWSITYGKPTLIAHSDGYGSLVDDDTFSSHWKYFFTHSEYTSTSLSISLTSLFDKITNAPDSLLQLVETNHTLLAQVLDSKSLAQRLIAIYQGVSH